MTLAGFLCMLSLLLPAQAGPDARPLAEPYVDGSYGFSIRPPSGWRLVRQRIPETRGATLLRMVQSLGAGRNHQIILRHTATTKTLPISEMLRELADTLSLEFSNFDIHSQQVQEIAGRPAGYLSATITRSTVLRPALKAASRAASQTWLTKRGTPPERS